MPRVEGQFEGSSIDRRSIADVIELRFGPQPDADRFADLLVDPETDRIEIRDLVIRLYTYWKKSRSTGSDDPR